MTRGKAELPSYPLGTWRMYSRVMSPSTIVRYPSTDEFAQSPELKFSVFPAQLSIVHSDMEVKSLVMFVIVFLHKAVD